MAIIRWNPWRDWAGDFFDLVPLRREESRWIPAVDISENDGSLFVDVEIPGMKKEDIKVSLEKNVLSLKGEKKQEKEVKEENYHRWERSYGSFVRSFELPMPVQADKIKANYRDGVLHVELPKAEEIKPKEIPIEVK
jgi:HSP20 family protein